MPEDRGVGAAAGGMAFSADAWEGGAPCAPDWYGRPCVALYGGEGVYGRATLRFRMDAPPTERMVLTVSGLGDETGTPFPFGIEVNGVYVGEAPSGFSNWDPAEHGAQGERAPWGTKNVRIPAELFSEGWNEVAIVSLLPDEHAQGMPYLLLGEASLSPESAIGAFGGSTVDGLSATVSLMDFETEDALPLAAVDDEEEESEGDGGKRSKGNGKGRDDKAD